MSLKLLSILTVVACVSAAEGAAQTTNVSDRRETRASLQAAAADADAMYAKAKSKTERGRYQELARALHERLDLGDLRVGDRIIIEGINLPDPALSDTFVVRAGQLLWLPSIATEIPLRGVLRFELADHITMYLREMIRDPQLRTTTTMGIYVTGQVAAPGVRIVSHDALLRDVVTAAGTMTPMANINKITVRRRGIVLYEPDSIRAALTDGRTFDDLRLVGGDEIEVGMKRQTNVYTLLQFATGTLGLILSIYTLSNR